MQPELRNMLQPKTFETERLILRPTNLDDAKLILELVNTPKWIEFIGDRGVKNIDDAEAYIKNKITPQLERLGYGNYTIIVKSDGSKIGSCGLYDREGLEGIDIGFALLPAYEKKGYAFEGTNKLKEAAFGEFGLSEISAIVVEKNKASQNLLSNMGLSFEKNIVLPNSAEEVMLYKMFSKEM